MTDIFSKTDSSSKKVSIKSWMTKGDGIRFSFRLKIAFILSWLEMAKLPLLTTKVIPLLNYWSNHLTNILLLPSLRCKLMGLLLIDSLLSNADCFIPLMTSAITRQTIVNEYFPGVSLRHLELVLLRFT